MGTLEDLYRLPDEFRGVARLFPLPNLVLFPHVLQPLHIFEPRYRELMAEAVAGDRLIAMAVLAPGWEDDYEGRPALRPIACLGKVATFHQLDDGCYNLLVAGLRRIRLVRELPPTKLFREAQVELIEDEYPESESLVRPTLYRHLLEGFRHFVPKVAEIEEQIEQLLSAEIPLGTLTDIVSYTLDLSREVKETLLAERCVDRRAQLLLEQLTKLPKPTSPLRSRSGTFPPEFSPN